MYLQVQQLVFLFGLLIVIIMADSSSKRLSPLDEIRTILAHTSQAELITFSEKNEANPSSSMINITCDAYGYPIIALNSSEAHAKDLKANPKCSLLVAKDPADPKDLVITLHGDVAEVSDEDKEVIHTTYVSMHPNALRVDSDDFQFMRINPKVVEYKYGVESREFSREEYEGAKVDPIYQFSEPISKHMNKDHTQDTKLIVQHSTSLPVTYAKMLDVDSLGFNVKAGVAGDTLKLRIPFPRRAVDRKDVRILVIEMLKAAKASLAAAADKDL